MSDLCTCTPELAQPGPVLLILLHHNLKWAFVGQVSNSAAHVSTLSAGKVPAAFPAEHSLLELGTGPPQKPRNGPETSPGPSEIGAHTPPSFALLPSFFLPLVNEVTFSFLPRLLLPASPPLLSHFLSSRCWGVHVCHQTGT